LSLNHIRHKLIKDKPTELHLTLLVCGLKLLALRQSCSALWHLVFVLNVDLHGAAEGVTEDGVACRSFLGRGVVEQGKLNFES
jgi:hypothetical protein